MGTVPAGMVRVAGGRFQFRNHPPVKLDDFWLDRYEVTNRQYKEFVEQGGYRKPEYWKEPFVKDGRILSWREAVLSFGDATGRPGPSTWEAGTFAEGEGEYPVGGVSWFEAAAYAEFAGKDLPTFHHWFRASGPERINLFVDILYFSNFGGKGPVPVGTLGGISPFGTFDMAGNVQGVVLDGVTRPAVPPGRRLDRLRDAVLRGPRHPVAMGPGPRPRLPVRPVHDAAPSRASGGRRDPRAGLLHREARHGRSVSCLSDLLCL